MKVTRLAVALFFFVFCPGAFAQETLDNEAILKLLKAGVSEDVVAGLIEQRPGKYALSSDDLVNLKNAGVPDKVLAAMVNKGVPTAPPPTLAPNPVVSTPSLPLMLHDGTPVRLRLSRNLSSADAKTGDTVDFEVLEDVKADDLIVVLRGATALGTIAMAQHKRRMARGGKLDVAIDHVRLTNGDKVALRAVKETSGGGHTGAMTGGMVATAILVWPAAPFFLFMHGKDSQIPKGTEITAYVNGEVRLERDKFKAP